MGFLPQEVIDRLQTGGPLTPDAKVLRGEAMFVGEAADYPRSLADFVGQPMAKEQIEVAIASARARRTRLDHMLLAAGEPGIGKTTLAYLVAYLMGAGLVYTNGKGLSADEFHKLTSGCVDGDCIFVDEIHLAVEGNRNRADWLLPWMLGNGLKTSRGVVQTPDVTLLAATTDAGKLPLTILDRFMNTPELEPYSREDGPRLAANLTRRLDVDLPEEWFGPIATAGDLNPRRIRKVLCKIRDLQHVAPDTHPNFDKALEHAGVTADGLTITARNILIVLATRPKRTASIATIGHELGEPGPLAHHERALLRRRYIDIDGQGRRLTDLGYERAAEVFK